MKKLLILISFLLGMRTMAIELPSNFEKDIVKTKNNQFEISFIGHGSIIFKFNDKFIYVDPYGKLADYSKFPKADLILITHEHQDHLDVSAIDKVKTDKTEMLLTEICYSKINKGTVLKNGETKNILGLKIEAVPAYNIIHKRDNGLPFHPKGEGNGYVITFDDKTVYIAGDTENVPEMKNLKNVDVAFLPMNLPYTMTPDGVVEAIKLFSPKILYPYHFGETNTEELLKLVKTTNIKDTEIKIRKMK